MAHHPLRKIFQKTGFDFHKYRPESDRLGWPKAIGVKTVLDVGANTGQFAKEIREILPDAQIYAFEPLADCYAELLENMKSDHKFKAFNFALGDTDGDVSMNRSSSSASSSILTMADTHKKLFPHTSGSTKETIKVRRLDNVKELDPTKLAKPILLKIDTQGFEDKVIRGATSFLKQVKMMIVETSFMNLYEHQPLFKDIYALLTAQGFSYHGSLHQRLKPVTRELIYEDSFFVRE